MDIQYGNMNITSILQSTIYNIAGTYSLTVPYTTTGMYFEMIGAGGAIQSGTNSGGTGGYMLGYINLPSNVSTLKIVVGAPGTATFGGTPSGASYITVGNNIGPLFAIVGAGGAGSFVIQGGAGGGGVGAFTSGVAPGGNAGACSGSGGSQSGLTTGGRGVDGFCNTVSGANGESYPGIAGLYEQSLGGNIGGYLSGGSGYAGGGGAGVAGAGGSSYYDTNSTTITTSYGATTAIPGGVLSGYGRAGQSGYVMVSFFNANETSFAANGDISCRNLITTSSINLNDTPLNVSTVIFQNVLSSATGRILLGVQTGTSTFRMEINNFGGTSVVLPAGYKYTSTGQFSNTTNPDTIQMKVEHGIWASIFYAASDRRIKKNIIPYDATNVLQTLQQIKPVTYQYIDQARHQEIEYGFVAQDIEPVLPYAVTKGIDYIPNIYDLADWSTLTQSTTLLTLRNKTTEDIEVNDELKILDLQERPLTLQVMDKTTQTMTVNANLKEIVAPYEPSKQEEQSSSYSNTVFVYGKKVDDLQVVDKDAIFSVGIAAMQEIDHIAHEHATRLHEHQHILEEIKQMKNKIKNMSSE